MNKQLFILFTVVLFLGCRKVERNPMDYYPQVKTTGLELLPDGSVKVTGEIISHGPQKVLYAGFCMDTVNNPAMLSNQQVIDWVPNKSFSTTYATLERGHKYYFRAWTANEYGYALANESVSIDSVTIGNDFIPCELPYDTLTLDNGYSKKNYYYNSISEVSSSGSIELDCFMSASVRMLMSFSKKPTNGVYTISDNSGVGENTVRIYLGGTVVQTGSKVYVSEKEFGEIEITICEAKVYKNNENNTFSLKFKTFFE